jgi:hypothetical protein
VTCEYEDERQLQQGADSSHETCLQLPQHSQGNRAHRRPGAGRA